MRDRTTNPNAPNGQSETMAKERVQRSLRMGDGIYGWFPEN
ncbi:MAG TPA: hypothetical protein PLU87_13320 [Sedimentisphaerales bacterium]|nr:hypothetical protein [Sedimentisphaerales bacterium]HRS10935.1 hypothetical protein [Sedimentisphaerales bacterium]HRV48629.1 hypothetical protein [Sedimentisphaerales bacterium]